MQARKRRTRTTQRPVGRQRNPLPERGRAEAGSIPGREHPHSLSLKGEGRRLDPFCGERAPALPLPERGRAEAGSILWGEDPHSLSLKGEGRRLDPFCGERTSAPSPFQGEGWGEGWVCNGEPTTSDSPGHFISRVVSKSAYPLREAVAVTGPFSLHFVGMPRDRVNIHLAFRIRRRDSKTHSQIAGPDNNVPRTTA